MGRVSNKVALVTGAAQGLGAAVAAMLAREGASVVLTDINIDGARKQAQIINNLHAGRAIAIEQLPAPMIDINKIKANCSVANAGFAVSRQRQSNFLKLEHARTTKLLDYECFSFHFDYRQIVRS